MTKAANHPTEYMYSIGQGDQMFGHAIGGATEEGPFVYIFLTRYTPYEFIRLLGWLNKLLCDVTEGAAV